MPSRDKQKKRGGGSCLESFPVLQPMLLLLFLLVYVLASYTIAIPAEMYRRARACTRVRGGGQRAVGGTNNSAAGKRKKLTNQSCLETFLRITSANQKNSFLLLLEEENWWFLESRSTAV